MNDTKLSFIPDKIFQIERDTIKLGFTMASDYQTGSLLRTLAATKKKGRILELGTGTGLSACWLLNGMDKESLLETVDDDFSVVEMAKRHLKDDSRVKFHVQDGSIFLRERAEEKYDLIFADTWPGKYTDFDLCLSLLKEGGFYIVDDMLPQKNWPEDHKPKVEKLIKKLDALKGFHITKLCWSTGIIIVTKAQSTDEGNA